MVRGKLQADTKRCVYQLPGGLHDRVVAFQERMGLPTEVEAVRRLLDQALQHKDTCRDIAKRFQAEILSGSTLRRAAQSVLAGHPLVQSIEFGEHDLKFTLTTREAATVRANGEWNAVTPGGLAPREAGHAA